MSFEPERLSFQELSKRLSDLEAEYGYSTIEFFRRYRNGEMGDDEAWLAWAGLYHLYLTSLPIRQLIMASDSTA
jgi:hypothetical protein